MNKQGRAFSLIELLVVISIIGIVMSIALLSLGLLGDDRELQTEGRRIVALVQVAQDEAVMQGRDFGLEFMLNAYRFVEYDPFLNVWGELIGDDTLRVRQLPEDFEFDLFLEGQRVLLALDPASLEEPDEADRRDLTETYAPHILIFSSGDTTPFELRIVRRTDDQEVVLENNLLGDIKFAEAEE
ncbi:MAG: type II secretion system minor pseudopilin GspH [Gammaproteobacteria bacterium]|nr:type II secretion system minor pseudopilin GspH [Gammaproteobacteria bacterium]MDH3429059.1 type II secretion system minor pseudopilin GspH [Gammaproteobacteria bacterium]MDH3433097.1 type II secretion system minor pseudopilin GspH [Gammaproteobacteria bacterium]